MRIAVAMAAPPIYGIILQFMETVIEKKFGQNQLSRLKVNLFPLYMDTISGPLANICLDMN